MLIGLAGGMPYLPDSLLTWRHGDQLHVGLRDGGPAPLILDGVTNEIARALELAGTSLSLARAHLSGQRAEVRTHFDHCLQQLRMAGHLVDDLPCPATPPWGIWALDAHPLTAHIARELATTGVHTYVGPDATAVSTTAEAAELRHSLAQRGRLGNLPTTTTALLTCAYVPDPARIAPLMREDMPFIVLTVRPRVIEVSPVVIPGCTPCPTCAACAQQDADDRYFIMASQWRTLPVPSYTATAELVASAAVITSLHRWYDQLPTMGATINQQTGHSKELAWQVHPRCACTTPAPDVVAAGRPTSTLGGQHNAVAGAERQVEEEPDREQRRPRDPERDHEGEHARHHRTETDLRLVAAHHG